MKKPPDPQLQARASLARRLIRDGELSPWTALYLVVRPTEAILEAERETGFAARWLAEQEAA